MYLIMFLVKTSFVSFGSSDSQRKTLEVWSEYDGDSSYCIDLEGRYNRYSHEYIT